MWLWLLGIVLLAGVAAIVALPRRASTRGGESDADAAWMAGQVLAESDAWRETGPRRLRNGMASGVSPGRRRASRGCPG